MPCYFVPGIQWNVEAIDIDDLDYQLVHNDSVIITEHIMMKPPTKGRAFFFPNKKMYVLETCDTKLAYAIFRYNSKTREGFSVREVINEGGAVYKAETVAIDDMDWLTLPDGEVIPPNSLIVVTEAISYFQKEPSTLAYKYRTLPYYVLVAWDEPANRLIERIKRHDEPIVATRKSECTVVPADERMVFLQGLPDRTLTHAQAISLYRNLGLQLYGGDNGRPVC